MKNIKKTIAVALVSITLSASAFAGNWGVPVYDGAQQITQGTQPWAGYTIGSQESGACTTGTQHKYAVVTWTNQIRGVAKYYTQTCI